MNRIGIIGTGYVGLITGVCFANIPMNKVICLDTDKEKIKLLKKGIPTIKEFELEKFLGNALKQRTIEFTTSYKKLVKNSDVIFVCVGTPQLSDGSCNLSYVNLACDEIISEIKKCDNDALKIVVIKSTVPPGTCKKLQEEFDKHLEHSYTIAEVVSNPEFLREGNAIEDFMNPDRIVIGRDFERTYEQDAYLKVLSCYGSEITDSNRLCICSDTTTSELIKYASNAFLATKITFINQIAEIASSLGANISQVAKGVGMDKRIGEQFLKAGCGYGGSCFPKDVNALASLCKDNRLVAGEFFECISTLNDYQKTLPFIKLTECYPTLRNKTIGIWGVTFKPDTDDIRESPALRTIEALLNEENVKIKIYDPCGIENLKKYFQGNPEFGYCIEICNDPYEATIDASALILQTEWKEFGYHEINWTDVFQNMINAIIIDGRNKYISYQKELENEGFKYIHI